MALNKDIILKDTEDTKLYPLAHRDNNGDIIEYTYLKKADPGYQNIISTVENQGNDIINLINATENSFAVKYAYGASPTIHPEDSEFIYNNQPARVEGLYIWKRSYPFSMNSSQGGGSTDPIYEMIQALDSSSGINYFQNSFPYTDNKNYAASNVDNSIPERLWGYSRSTTNGVSAMSDLADNYWYGSFTAGRSSASGGNYARLLKPQKYDNITRNTLPILNQLRVGDCIAVSYEIWADHTVSTRCYCYSKVSTSSVENHILDTSETDIIQTNTWFTVYKTGVVTQAFIDALNNTNCNYASFEIEVNDDNENLANTVNYRIRKCQFEIGYSSTPWTAAPEDLYPVTVNLSATNNIFTSDDNNLTREESFALTVDNYKGNTKIFSFVGNINTPEHITATVSSNNSLTPIVTISVDGGISGMQPGNLTIPVTVDNVTYNKIFNYSWVKDGVSGAGGRGISSVTEYYRTTTENEAPEPSTSAPWSTTVPQLDSENKYLWNFEVITYTVAPSPLSTPVALVGVFGDDGRSIVNITEYYLATSASSGVTKDTPGWSTEIQFISEENKYLWNYERITYDRALETSEGTGTNYDETDPAIIGRYGDTGNGIQYIDYEYMVTEEQVKPSADSSEWASDIPLMSSTYKYLWRKVVTIYTNHEDETVIELLSIFGDTGTAGANGYNTASIYLYQRTSDTPIRPEGDLIYNFRTRELTETSSSVLNGWSQELPPQTSANDPLWLIVATASSENEEDIISDEEWQEPIILAENGADGANGLDGYNQATINLFKRADTAPSKPYTGDSRDVTYTFSSGTLAPIATGWSLSIPDDENNQPCFISSISVVSRHDQVNINKTSWSDPSKIAENGIGIVRIIYTYMRTSSASAPSEDSSEWGPAIPTLDNTYRYLWKKQEIIYSDDNSEHSHRQVTVSLEAVQGAAGVNQMVVNLYQRSATAPTSAPTATIYNFPNKSLRLKDDNGNWNGWSTTMPADNGDPCWLIVAIASTDSDEDEILQSEWGPKVSNPTRLDPIKYVASGNNNATVYIYKQGTSAAAVGRPAGDLTYNFNSKTLSGSSANFNGWSMDIPESSTTPTWVMAAVASSTTNEDIIRNTEWNSNGSAVKFTQNGTDGYNTATIYLYMRSAEEPDEPDTPSYYKFSNSTLYSDSRCENPITTLDGWSTTIPAISSDTSLSLWVTAAVVTSQSDVAEVTTWVTPAIMAENGLDGNDGANGSDGISITGVDEYYQATSTNAAPSTTLIEGSLPSDWKLNDPTRAGTFNETNKYLWNTERIKYSNSTVGNPTSPSLVSIWTVDGEPGRGISSITDYYLVSNQSTGITIERSDWDTTPGVTTQEQPYLWNYEEITWTSRPLTTHTDPTIIGVHGNGAEVYSLKVSDTAIIRDTNNSSSSTARTLSPSSITLSAYSTIGNSSDEYSGRFKIEKKSNGGWEGVVTTSSDSNTYTYSSINSDNIRFSKSGITINNGSDASWTTTGTNRFQNVSVNGSSSITLPAGQYKFTCYIRLTTQYPSTTSVNARAAVIISGTTYSGGTINKPAGATPTTGTSSVIFTLNESTSVTFGVIYSLPVGTGTNTVSLLQSNTFIYNQTTRIRASLYQRGGTSVLLDQQTIPIINSGADGEDSLSVWLSNENHTFAGDKDGVPIKINGENQSTTSEIYAYKGTNRLTVNSVSYSPVTGLNLSWSNSTITITALQDPAPLEAGTVNISVITGGKTFVLPFSYSVSKVGATGEQGPHGINTATVELFKTSNNSPTDKPNDGVIYYFEDDSEHSAGELSGNLNGWQQALPTGAPIWKITAVALSNSSTDTINTSDWTNPIKVTGTDGTSPILYSLEVSDNVIVRDVNTNTLTPNFITVTGTKQEGSTSSSVDSNNIKVQYYDSQWHNISLSSGKYPIPVNAYSVVSKLKATIEIDNSVLDTQIIPVVNSGADEKYITTDNDSHIFPATEGHAVNGSMAVVNIKYFSGATQEAITNFSVSPASDNSTISYITTTNGNTKTVTFTAHNGLTAKSGEFTFTVNNTYEKKFSWSLGSSDGVSYNLITTPVSIVRNVNTNTLNSNTVTVTATKQIGSSAAVAYTNGIKVEYTEDGSNWVEITGPVNNVYTIPENKRTSVKQLKATLTVGSTIVDTQTIPVIDSGEDGYAAGLTNDNHTFGADKDGKPLSGSNTTTTTGFVYKGGTALTVTNISWGALPSQDWSVSKVANSNNTVTITAPTNSVVTNGKITFTLTADGKTFNTDFSYSVSRTGSPGLNTATVSFYKRSDNGIQSNDTPGTVVYTFNPPSVNPTTQNNWSHSIPSGSDPCYVRSARAVSNGPNATISSWSDAVKLVENGINTAKIDLYQRRSSGAPNTPSERITYTFATNVIKGNTSNNDGITNPINTGWYKVMPEDNGNPCYITSAIALGTGESDTIETTDWTAPVRLVESGKDGKDATAYYLLLDNDVLIKSKNGTITPSSIVVSAKSKTGTDPIQNYTGRFTVEYSTNGTTFTTITNSAWSGDKQTFTLSINTTTIPNLNSSKALRISLYLAGGTSTLLDQQIIPILTEGADAYTVFIPNNSHQFIAGVSAAEAATLRVFVKTYKGNARIASTLGNLTFSPYSGNSNTNPPTGMTITNKTNGLTSADGYFDVNITTSFVTKSGTITVPTTVDNITYNLEFSYSLSLKGNPGDQGVGIIKVEPLYYLNDAHLNIQLKGDTSQTGTPTPSTPIEVHSVKGDNEIIIAGSNKFNPRNIITTITKNGITATYDADNQIYTFNGTCTTDNTTFALGDNEINVLSGTTKLYVFWKGGTVTNYCSMRLYNSAYTLSVITSALNLSQSTPSNVVTASSTFTSPPDYQNIRFNNGSVATNFKIQIAVSDTQLNGYEEYIGTSYQINLPVKNLCNYINNRVTNGITFTYNSSTGGVSVKGTATANAYSDTTISSTLVQNYPYVPAGTYTVSLNSGKGASDSNIRIRCQYWYDDGTTAVVIDNVAAYGSFTITKKARLYIRVVVLSGATVDEVVYPQLEVGSKANTFHPYNTQVIELNKIGTNQDYIFKNNNNWYVHKTVGHLSLMVSNMNNSNSYPGWKNSGIRDIVGTGKNTSYSSGVIVNVGTRLGANTTSDGDTCWLPTDGYNGLTQTQWLEQYPDLGIEIYVPYTTPVDIEITDSNLNSQLDNLATASASRNTVSITQINDDLPFIVSYSTSATTPPGTPTNEVTTSTSLPGEWSLTPPIYKDGYVYYSCTQIHYDNNTVNWSNVILITEFERVNKNIATNNSEISTLYGEVNSKSSTEYVQSEVTRLDNNIVGVSNTVSQQESLISQNSTAITGLVRDYTAVQSLANTNAGNIAELEKVSSELSQSLLTIEAGNISLLSETIKEIKEEQEQIGTAFRVEDDGAYVYNGTKRNRLVTNLFYLKNNENAPNLPISAVDSTSTDVDTWTTVIPINDTSDDNYIYYFTCRQIYYNDTNEPDTQLKEHYFWNSLYLVPGIPTTKMLKNNEAEPYVSIWKEKYTKVDTEGLHTFVGTNNEVAWNTVEGTGTKMITIAQQNDGGEHWQIRESGDLLNISFHTR